MQPIKNFSIVVAVVSIIRGEVPIGCEVADGI